MVRALLPLHTFSCLRVDDTAMRVPYWLISIDWSKSKKGAETGGTYFRATLPEALNVFCIAKSFRRRSVKERLTCLNINILPINTLPYSLFPIFHKKKKVSLFHSILQMPDRQNWWTSCFGREMDNDWTKLWYKLQQQKKKKKDLPFIN